VKLLHHAAVAPAGDVRAGASGELVVRRTRRGVIVFRGFRCEMSWPLAA
jgi:hypothetical protein